MYPKYVNIWLYRAIKWLPVIGHQMGVELFFMSPRLVCVPSAFVPNKLALNQLQNSLIGLLYRIYYVIEL